MSDWTTVRATVIDEYGIPDVAAQQARVERAMCEALKVLRGLEFSFNRGELSFSTVSGQSDYERAQASTPGASLLPYDFWGLLGRYVFNTTVSSDRRIPITNARRLRKYQNLAASLNSGRPRRVTVENHKLKFYPTPDSVATIEGTYLRDLGTPTPFRSSSGVTYPVAQAWQYDDGEEDPWTDLTGSLNAPTGSAVQPFPSTPAEDDAFYVGWKHKITSPITITVATSGVGAYTVSWSYWNGSAWVALSGVTDNTNSFKAAPGANTLVFTVPSDWRSTSLNSSNDVFYLRAVDDVGGTTTPPELQQITAIGDDAWYYYLDWYNGVQVVDGDYSNDWFTRAFMALVHGTAYQYLLGFAKDQEQAQRAQVLYASALASLRTGEAPLVAVGDVRLSLGY